MKVNPTLIEYLAKQTARRLEAQEQKQQSAKVAESGTRKVAFSQKA